MLTLWITLALIFFAVHVVFTLLMVRTKRFLWATLVTLALFAITGFFACYTVLMERFGAG